MKKVKIEKDDRVEYAMSVEQELPGVGERIKARKHYVGYVKKLYRKWFTAYADICECKTHRIDRVKVSDIYGKVEKKAKPTKINNHDGN